jgi:stage V sporulation protein G
MNEITEIQIIPVKPKEGIVAFASFVLNGSLYLSSIAVMTRPAGGFRLVYPTKKVGAKGINLFHPINRDFAQLIEKAVLKKFEDVMSRDDRHHCSYAATRSI